MFSSEKNRDKVFLLDIDQANSCLGSNEERMCKPTAYAIDQGAYHDSSNGNCWWWLRTPGSTQNSAAHVDTVGDVSEYVRNVNYSDGAVRPAMWIELK